MPGCRFQNSVLRRRLSFEVLEDRQMLAVFTVTDLSDSVVTGADQAPGTLRQAIFDANDTPLVADVIEFAANLTLPLDLSVVGDTAAGASALVVSSPLTIRGNANGTLLQRDSDGPEMRLFRVSSTGNLTLESITLSGGIAHAANSAVPGQVGADGRGGAVLNQGTLEVMASTLYGNSAIGGNAIGAAGGAGLGGAIANDGGTLTIKNSTLSGNSVASGGGNTTTASFGGGVHSHHGLLRIYNSTLTSNSASSGRQVFVLSDIVTATVELFSSIVAQQDAPFQSRDFVALADGSGELFISASNNIVRTQIGLSEVGGFIDADPMLALLAENGGPTLTHAIPITSPAINSGSNVFNLTNDQRGSTIARSIGAAVDIGAFELRSAPALSGDYNRDDTVDAADYVVWRKTMGSGVTIYDSADGDGSGFVDPGDYPVWTKNFAEDLIGGSGGSNSFGTVPTTIAAPDVRQTVLFLYDFASGVARDDDAVQIEAPLVPLEQSQISDDTHDKALLAMLLGWDSTARGERRAD